MESWSQLLAKLAFFGYVFFCVVGADVNFDVHESCISPAQDSNGNFRLGFCRAFLISTNLKRLRDGWGSAHYSVTTQKLFRLHPVPPCTRAISKDLGLHPAVGGSELDECCSLQLLDFSGGELQTNKGLSQKASRELTVLEIPWEYGPN